MKDIKKRIRIGALIIFTICLPIISSKYFFGKEITIKICSIFVYLLLILVASFILGSIIYGLINEK